MGENLKMTSASAYWTGGPEEYIPVGGVIPMGEIAAVSLFEEEKNADPHIELYKEPITFRLDIKPLHNKLSRKKFKKWLMSIGFGRNLAEYYCQRISQKHIPYKHMQLPFLIDWLGTTISLMED